MFRLIEPMDSIGVTVGPMTPSPLKILLQRGFVSLRYQLPPETTAVCEM